MKAYLAAVLESADEAIIGMTPDGLVTCWNRAAERLFGYLQKEACGKDAHRLVPPELAGEDSRILHRIRQGENVVAFETVRLRRDEEPMKVSLTGSPIRDQTGAIRGAVLAIRPVQSDLQRHAHKLEVMVAERTAHLQQTIAELEGVSYSLSHDLRGPLRTIQGFVQLVLEDAGDRLNPEEKELLTKAINAAHRLDRLIQDVLAYTRVSRQSVVMENIDIERLLRQIVDERPEFRPPRAELKIESPLLKVQGHEASLTQIITNLLDNAVKFIPPERQPVIRIFSRPSGAFVELWFEDNGIGIPRDAQARLFAIFQRVHDDKRYPGTGIGLAIVRKAVERMGGSVRLESEAGMGSRFCVSLPKGLP